MVFFPGNIKAIKDIWFVGDDFINQTYHSLPAMANEAKIMKKKRPYVYNYFNVKCFSTSLLSETKNIMACLVNSLIKALNDAEFLPRIIIVVADGDIIKQVNYFGFGVDFVLGPIINWIVNNMERAIDCRKTDLANRLPGAVIFGEPKVIWVKMMDKPNGYDRGLALHHKFNKLLENILYSKRNHYIMDVNQKLQEPAFFTLENKLNADGRLHFWLEVDEQLKKFDQQRLSLDPREPAARDTAVLKKPQKHVSNNVHVKY